MVASCQAFIDRLDDLLEGRLIGPELHAVRDHIRICAPCRLMTRQSGEDLGASPPLGLTADILRRTSGPPCASAQRRLCDYVDGVLEAIDTELVRNHMGGCEECAALSRVLNGLSMDLPLLAELAPDNRLADDIISRTLPQRHRSLRWVMRAVEAWQRTINRPRFAWEGAYIGTLFLFLVFATPGSPLAGVPQRALELASVDPVATLRPPVARLEARVSTRVESVWDTTREEVTEAWREMAGDAARLRSAAIERIKSELGTFLERAPSDPKNNETGRPSDVRDRMEEEKP
jgi:predicted anti-sigma-YlaC factor YlaD